jgi:hypothetical protein
MQGNHQLAQGQCQVCSKARAHFSKNNEVVSHKELFHVACKLMFVQLLDARRIWDPRDFEEELTDILF